MKTLLVLGQTGQVARALAKLGPPPGWTLRLSGRERFDLAQDTDFAGLIAGASVVINAAAYTQVEAAEDNSDAAFALNRDAPARLAAACAAAGIPLVHFSTDYVFDGEKDGAYVETDARSPLNVYGLSKAQGEDAVLASGARTAILRTSWVYSPTGSNFVRTMLRLAAERDEVRVVDDQIGRPTSAGECAEAAVQAAVALEAGADLGVLHLAGADDAVWADIAQAVFETLPSPPRLVRVSSSEFPTRARRPRNSRLDTGRIAEVLGWQARPWRYSLAGCLKEIGRDQ